MDALRARRRRDRRAGGARGRDLSGQHADAARPVYCRRGAQSFPATVPVTYDVGEPVVSWGVQCTGPATTSLCFTGDGSDRWAHLHLQSAVVTVDDPVAPVVEPGLPGDGVRRTNEIFTAAASDSAGIRSLRVLVDGVARVDDHYTATSACPRRARRRARATSTSRACPTAATR